LERRSTSRLNSGQPAREAGHRRNRSKPAQSRAPLCVLRLRAKRGNLLGLILVSRTMALAYGKNSPQQMLAKAEWDLAHLEAAEAAQKRDEVSDALFNLAVSLTSVKDWLKEQTNVPFTRASVESYVSASTALSSFRDIANAGKHRVITKYVPTTQDVMVSATFVFWKAEIRHNCMRHPARFGSKSSARMVPVMAQLSWAGSPYRSGNRSCVSTLWYPEIGANVNFPITSEIHSVMALTVRWPVACIFLLKPV